MTFKQIKPINKQQKDGKRVKTEAQAGHPCPVQHFEWFFKTGRNDKPVGFCGALTTLPSSSLWTVKSLSLESQLK